MERKTSVQAEDGKQEIIVTREFDLPVEVLFRAYVEPELVEQWMGTNVLKLENKIYGSWHFETTDPKGNTYAFSGVIHEFCPNQRITRTFQMERMPASGAQFPVQLEFIEFVSLTKHTSKLLMHIVFKSVDLRDQMVRLPFAQGLNWAHNRLQTIVGQLN